MAATKSGMHRPTTSSTLLFLQVEDFCKYILDHQDNTCLRVMREVALRKLGGLQERATKQAEVGDLTSWFGGEMMRAHGDDNNDGEGGDSESGEDEGEASGARATATASTTATAAARGKAGGAAAAVAR